MQKGPPQPASLTEQLVGTWKLHSATVERKGIKAEMYGPSPMGIEVFQADGHFATICARADVPNFKSASREEGTLEESTRAMRGSIGYWGKYTVHDANVFTFHIEGSTFPNWRGTEQKRLCTISDGQAVWDNPNPSAGGTAKFVWKRV